MNMGEYFIEMGKLNEPQLEDAIFVQSVSEKRLGDILIENGYVSDADVAAYIALESGRDYFGDLAGLFIDAKENEMFGFSFLYDIPAVIARRNDTSYMVCSEITSGLSERMAFDENLTGFKIGISTKKKIYEALNKIFINKAGVSEKEVLDEAIDIALLKGAPNLRIKRSDNFYIIGMDAETRRETLRVVSLESGRKMINIIAANCQLSLKKGEGADAKFIFLSNFYKGLRVSIRVAFLPISSRLDKELSLFEAVLRIHGLNRVLDFKSIGFSQDKTELLKKSYIYPDGLIIATGPTGSGKTTTFYAMLKLLSAKKSSIITIEDPVEVELKEPNITQMNISENFGYAEAVRVMLRSEPDIMMIGEIRDDVTAKYALIAAETGHLVLATLHANSSLSIFGRFNSLGISMRQLIPVLRIVTGQRLYNPLCPACKKMAELDSLPAIYREAILSDMRFAASLAHGQKYEREYDAPDNGKSSPKHFDDANCIYPTGSNMGLYLKELAHEATNIAISGLNYLYVRGEKNCSSCGGSGYAKRKPIIEIAEFSEQVKEEASKKAYTLSEYMDMEDILTTKTNFESLKAQAFIKLISGEIDPITYFNLIR